MSKELTLLSKTMSHALRHAPWLYELELDEQGWVLIEELLMALRLERDEWKNLAIDDLAKVITSSSKQRHEIQGNKIRALYGHSTPHKLIKDLAEPLEILFHGTRPQSLHEIKRNGLKPMSRHYVHLSIDIEMAKQVGARKSKAPIILEINAKQAYLEGYKFYKGNEHVWLADKIAPDYIIFI